MQVLSARTPHRLSQTRGKSDGREFKKEKVGFPYSNAAPRGCARRWRSQEAPCVVALQRGFGFTGEVQERKMSLKSFLSMQALASAMSQLKQIEAKFESHLAEDKAAITKEFEEAIAHWKALVAHLRTQADPATVANIDKGMDPHTAHQVAETNQQEPQRPAKTE
jgi:hypothetical protein